jgi:hypothetical protein
MAGKSSRHASFS